MDILTLATPAFKGDFNMKKALAVFCVSLLAVLLSLMPAVAATPEESFRTSFPGIKADSVKPTAVSGLFEVMVGGQIVYYAPGPEYLVYGPIVTSKGENLTEKKSNELLGAKLKTISLGKAIHIGSGKHQVVEITDVDCPFCRKASTYLTGRKDVTRYVFLMPAPNHPNAKAKTLQVFCSADRAKAYEEAMAGKLDDMKFTPCKSAAAEESLKAHQEIGKQVGVTGTPLFLIDGQVVLGADMARIEKILNEK
jgi:thiol:disulfide interchange protein DsbC